MSLIDKEEQRRLIAEIMREDEELGLYEEQTKNDKEYYTEVQSEFILVVIYFLGLVSGIAITTFLN